MTFYAIFGSRMRILSAITYVLMGWLVVFAFKPMVQNLNPLSLKLVLAGGVRLEENQVVALHLAYLCDVRKRVPFLCGVFFCTITDSFSCIIYSSMYKMSL